MTRIERADGRLTLKGQTVNGLRVGDVAQGRPLRWSTVCSRCGCKTSHTHDELLTGSARCKAGGCWRDKPLPKDESATKMAKRAAMAQAEAERQRRAEEQAEVVETAIAERERLEETYKRLAATGYEPEPAPSQSVRDTPALPTPVPAAVPDGQMIGMDPLSGEMRTFSAFEINRMDADSFRKTFRLDLRLPNTGPFYRLSR